MPVSSNSPFRLRTSASTNQPLELSVIFPYSDRRTMLNAHGVRSFVCSVDSMRAIRIHHEPCFLRERDGLSTDRICFQVSNSSECVRAPSLTLSNLMHLHLNYILCHSCVMFNRQRMYSPLYQRPSKATFTSWNTVGLFSISLLLRVAAASKSLSNAQIQGLFLLPSRIGMYKSTYPPSLNYTVPRRVSVLKGALKAPVPPLPRECRTPETRPRTSRRMRATPSRKALRTQVPESPTECSSLAKE